MPHSLLAGNNSALNFRSTPKVDERSREESRKGMENEVWVFVNVVEAQNVASVGDDNRSQGSVQRSEQKTWSEPLVKTGGVTVRISSEGLVRRPLKMFSCLASVGKGSNERFAWGCAV